MKVFEEELKIWKSRSDNKVVEALPPHVDISLNTNCNLSCHQCPYHGKDKIFNQTPCDMDFKLYKKIIDECSVKNVRSVKLSFSGEPLLYPKFYKAVKYAKMRGLQVSINSNGVLLNTANSIRLIKSGLDVIIISDYDLEFQLKGVSILQVQKQTFRSKKPYILMKTNSKKFDGIVDEVIPLEFQDYSKLEEDFKKYEFCCGYPWQRFLVLADGSVLSCSCGMGLIDLKNSYLGNMNHDITLEALWKSPKMSFLRVAHENNESNLIKMCRLCPIRKDILERFYDEKKV